MLSVTLLASATVLSAPAAATVFKTVYRITPRNYTGATNLDTVLVAHFVAKQTFYCRLERESAGSHR